MFPLKALSGRLCADKGCQFSPGPRTGLFETKNGLFGTKDGLKRVNNGEGRAQERQLSVRAQTVRAQYGHRQYGTVWAYRPQYGHTGFSTGIPASPLRLGMPASLLHLSTHTLLPTAPRVHLSCSPAALGVSTALAVMSGKSSGLSVREKFRREETMRRVFLPFF